MLCLVVWFNFLGDLILFLSLVVSTLLNFVRLFVKAHDENCKQIELDRKRAEKEAEHEKLKLAAAKKEAEHMMRTTIKSGDIKWYDPLKASKQELFHSDKDPVWLDEENPLRKCRIILFLAALTLMMTL